MLKVSDLKIDYIHMGCVVEKAIFHFNENENVTVHGNKSDGYTVWLTHFNNGKLLMKRMNPTNTNGEPVNYMEKERAILKANRVIAIAFQNIIKPI